MTANHWIITASQDHVAIGQRGGFCQACHGKKTPLERMKPGDGVVFYSPRTHMKAGAAVQAFTAIGVIADAPVIQVTMFPGFRPFRREVSFVASARSAPIGPMLGSLSFIRDLRRWGFPFRRGHFGIDTADFMRIAAAMGGWASTLRRGSSARRSVKFRRERFASRP